jgi:hypothetical protein
VLRAVVIPAKAGIYPANLRKCAVDGLDSRPSASSGQAFRGNDRRFERDGIPNDADTNPSHRLICVHRQPKMSVNKDAALAPQRAFAGDLN